MDALDLRRVVVSQEALDRVPASVARRLGALPISLAGETLRVALKDPDDFYAVDQLENLLNLRLEIVAVARPEDFDTAMRRYYPEGEGGEARDGAVGLVDRVMNRALQTGASDIHIDPTETGGMVRLRVDGRLRLYTEIDREMVNELVSHIKVLANLDIAERRVPMDGQITMHLVGEDANVRVATIPTIHGERVTLRLLSREDTGELKTMDDLGMSPPHHEAFLRALAAPSGVLLLSGPTGSGKTTTLYACLRHLRERRDRHIVSIEDPVELPIEGITQIRVDADGERVTFNRALRSVLRHDPDILMVGEIRDAESADIAVKSALTGHLVLATVHANSAAGILTRLLDLGVSPFLISSTVRLFAAQRLVRRPCEHCRGERPATAGEREAFGWDEDGEVTVPVPRGCSLCGGTGYAGRVALYEAIEIDAETRRRILEECGEVELARAAFAAGRCPNLHRDGAEKIRRGWTTVEEVRATTLPE